MFAECDSDRFGAVGRLQLRHDSGYMFAYREFLDAELLRDICI